MRYLRITIFSVISVILAIVVRKYWLDYSAINAVSAFLMAYVYYHFFGKQEKDSYYNILLFIIAIHVIIFGWYLILVLDGDATEFVGMGIASWCVTIYNEFY